MIKVPVVVAEVIIDGSVIISEEGGAKTISPDDGMYQIKASDGRLSGTNLYYSFKTFDINSGETANFTGPAVVSNIISRVTGGSASTIAGTIKSDISDVNLWLFNPAGVVFKEGASVDIGGSFYVTTADFIEFGNKVEFGVPPTATTTLTLTEPEAFGFIGDFDDSKISSKTINFQDVTINIPTGDLTIVGSKVVFQNSNISVPNGNINVAAVEESGQVRIDNGRLDMTEFDQLGEVLEENATLTAKTEGDVNIFKFTEPVVAIRDGVILLEYLPDQSLNEKISQLDVAKVSTNLAVIDQPCEQFEANTFSINFLIEKQGDNEETFLVSQREAGIASGVSFDTGCQ